MRPDLPTGTVTFLFTDVEGSTRLLHELGPESYAAALVQHRRSLREAFVAGAGVEVDTQGDAFFVAFPTAQGAVTAALAARDAHQRAHPSARGAAHGNACTERRGLRWSRRPPRRSSRRTRSRRPDRPTTTTAAVSETPKPRATSSAVRKLLLSIPSTSRQSSTVSPRWHDFNFHDRIKDCSKHVTGEKLRAVAGTSRFREPTADRGAGARGGRAELARGPLLARRAV